MSGGKPSGGVFSRATTLLRKARRRLWMKYALRGVGGADNFERLDLAYTVEDPWNMASDLERARFEQTNALLLREFGRPGSLLELGCGEGHQTEYFARLAESVHGVDVSAQAIDRARKRLPDAAFAATDIFGQPWGDTPGRFDVVTACEVLYYLRDPAATIARMRTLGRGGLVTFFAPAVGRIAPHLEEIPGVRHDWLYHGGTAWLAAWWHNDA